MKSRAFDAENSDCNQRKLANRILVMDLEQLFPQIKCLAYLSN